MSEAFHQKLAFVMKALSIGRGALAAQLEVDKSVISRWVTGRVQPSDHNLARLSVLIAKRVPGFEVLDWERPLQSLASLVGVDPAFAAVTSPRPDSLRLALLDQSRTNTRSRGGAYEGIFRSTRPYANTPGQFIHDIFMVARHDDDELSFVMMNSGVRVEGVCLLLHSQLFVIGAELTSCSFSFAIVNGVNTVASGLLDGIMLWCVDDRERTPTAAVFVLERLCDLTGDRDADEAAFAEFCSQSPLAPAGSIRPEIMAHISRDVGPSQAALGGDWLLRLPASRSVSAGPPRVLTE